LKIFVYLKDAGKSGICGTFETCCSEPEKIGSLTVPEYVHRCGIRYASGINRRVLTTTGKGESEFGEWPWQVDFVFIKVFAINFINLLLGCNFENRRR